MENEDKQADKGLITSADILKFIKYGNRKPKNAETSYQ